MIKKTMVELTISVSDELAERLKPHKNQLPELLWQVLEITNSSISNKLNAPQNQDIPSVYQEIIDFLITSPTPEEITNFKVSLTSQERLQFLLEKNRESSLTNDEIAELNIYEQLENLMMLLKIRAYSELT